MKFKTHHQYMGSQKPLKTKEQGGSHGWGVKMHGLKV